MRTQTVSVNGVVYHKRTGMPLREERGHELIDHSAHAVHSTLQKSRTLSRKYVSPSVKHPAHVAPVSTHRDAAPSVAPHSPQVSITVRPKPTHTPVVRSDMVARFKSITPTTHVSAQPKVIADIAPTQHHLAQRVAAVRTQPPAPIHHPSHVLKQLAIDKALDEAPSRTSRRDVKLVKKSHKFKRLASIASVGVAVILLGAYFTYLNMPALSTKVAAAQAGINANYPSYQPMGYSLKGAVSYEQGSVAMTFGANGSPQEFTLTQSKSGLDSFAVLDTVVAPKAGDSYQTTSSGGLTVYTYDGGAAWVNGGILYQIDTNAHLSPSQVQRIAASL